ncbi:MAG: hypothetical protein Q9166_006396 [cf. Caloplaca sp. 2 TL-2023]
MAEVVEREVDTGGAKQTFKDLFAGAAGGVAQVLSLYSSAAFTTLAVNSKPATPSKVCFTYPSFTLTTLFLVIYTALGKSPDLSYTQLYLSGAFAGLANSYLSGPIEHVRIRLQTQPHGEGRLYNGPVDCVRKLVKQGGGVGVVYRGQVVTLAREAQAYGVWFLTFEYLMRLHSERTSTPRSSIPAPLIALYGGIAGEALWLSSYPFDVVKSKMQSDGFGSQIRYLTMRDAFRQTWREEGVRGFWKGIGPTCVRALPVSAGTFIVVEMTMRAMS